jgi:hypothetical protein
MMGVLAPGRYVMGVEARSSVWGYSPTRRIHRVHPVHPDNSRPLSDDTLVED